MICMAYTFCPMYRPTGKEPGPWEKGTWDFEVTTSYMGRNRTFTFRAGGTFSEAVADTVALAKARSIPVGGDRKYSGVSLTLKS